MKSLAFFVGSIVLFFSLEAGAQEITISGIVLDSATFQPLSYVAVAIKGKNSGQSSLENGHFTITCSTGDTLAFSRLGYKVLLFRGVKNQTDISVLLPEDPRMLGGVTVYDELTIPGVDAVRKVPANNSLRLKEQSLETDPGKVATFGPGLLIPLGGGKDKTKEKRDEHSRTAFYRSVVTSAETKKELMSLFNISEATFYKKLEKFNQATPDAFYLTNRDEIVQMLVQFFALKE